jgi:hypothetical protein
MKILGFEWTAPGANISELDQFRSRGREARDYPVEIAKD